MLDLDILFQEKKSSFFSNSRQREDICILETQIKEIWYRIEGCCQTFVCTFCKLPHPSARTNLFLSQTKSKLSWTICFLSQTKNICPRLKSSYLLGKRIENYFQLWKTFFPWLKSYFPTISQAKMYFLA